MSPDNQNTTFSWLSGIPYEVAFWDSYYRNPKRRKDLFSWSLYGKECTLDNFDVTKHLESFGEFPGIMVDLGCALSYAFGNIVKGKEVPVIYMDPLAPFYNDILNRYKIDRPRISFGMGETLSANLHGQEVSLIHVRNALDHSASPITVIWQALEALRPGGVLYLNHFRNEGERENYRGFHQHNIDCKDGKLLIKNNKETIVVNDLLQGYALVEAGLTSEGRVYAIITRSNLPLPENINHNAMTFSAYLPIHSARYFHSFHRSMGYQCRRLYSTVGHRIMRLMPYGLLNRIKSLMGH